MWHFLGAGAWGGGGAGGGVSVGEGWGRVGVGWGVGGAGPFFLSQTLSASDYGPFRLAFDWPSLSALIVWYSDKAPLV